MNEILKSIKRTPYQSFASFLILFFTLFLSLFFFYLTSFFYGALAYVETKPEVTVYFDTKTPEADIFKTRDALLKSGKVSAVKYTSQQDALKIYRDLNRDDPLLLEMVSAEILPASLGFTTKQPEHLAQIAESLKKQTGVDEVEYQKSTIDRLFTFTTILRRVSLFVFIVLLTISMVVLVTTTAFKIALKKDEIELMQLLGASNGYIRSPFLLEGVFFGVLSASAAFMTFYFIYFYLQTFLKSYLSNIPQLAFFNLGHLELYTWPPSLYFIILSYGAIVLFGALIGFLGNLISTSKYIK